MSPRGETVRRLWPWLVYGVYCLVVAVAYWKTFALYYVQDDALVFALDWPFVFSKFLHFATDLQYRPGGWFFSWLVGQALPASPVTLRVVSLLLFSLAGWTVYAFARMLTQDEWVAVLAGVLFVAHPLNYFVMSLFLVAPMTLLGLSFMLLALVSFDINLHRGSVFREVSVYALCALALSCYEAACFGAPLFVMLAVRRQLEAGVGILSALMRGVQRSAGQALAVGGYALARLLCIKVYFGQNAESHYTPKAGANVVDNLTFYAKQICLSNYINERTIILFLCLFMALVALALWRRHSRFAALTLLVGAVAGIAPFVPLKLSGTPYYAMYCWAMVSVLAALGLRSIPWRFASRLAVLVFGMVFALGGAYTSWAAFDNHGLTLMGRSARRINQEIARLAPETPNILILNADEYVRWRMFFGTTVNVGLGTHYGFHFAPEVYKDPNVDTPDAKSASWMDQAPENCTVVYFDLELDDHAVVRPHLVDVTKMYGEQGAVSPHWALSAESASGVAVSTVQGGVRLTATAKQGWMGWSASFSAADLPLSCTAEVLAKGGLARAEYYLFAKGAVQRYGRMQAPGQPSGRRLSFAVPPLVGAEGGYGGYFLFNTEPGDYIEIRDVVAQRGFTLFTATDLLRTSVPFTSGQQGFSPLATVGE